MTWDIGAFTVACGGGLLWLVKLVISKELGDFETRLMEKLDKYRFDEIDRRLDALEGRHAR